MINNTWIELSKNALLHNINQIAEANPSSKLILMLKSNAYGHGLKEILKIIPPRQTIAFADLSDCIKYAQNNHQFIHFNKLESQNIDIYLKHNVIPVIEDVSDLKSISNVSNRIKVIVKVDTGMNRLGFKVSELDKILLCISKLENVEIHSIATHLSCYDDINNSNNDTQLLKIKQISDKFNQIPIQFKNSAGVIRQTSINSLYIRPGLSLYGYYPSADIQLVSNLQLKPILQLNCNPIAIKNIQIGESLGYGATFTATKETTYAILPVGYYHGLPRYLSNKGTVYYNNVECKIIGNICMNHTFIDISNIDITNNSNLVFEVIGDKEKNNANYISAIGKTIAYEVLASINPFIERRISNQFQTLFF